MNQEQLDRIEKKVDRLLAAADAKVAGHGGASWGGKAPDSELDSKYGDPEVRKDPKRWDGHSCEGLKYSQCPPEYLDVLADLLDWKAGKNEEKGTTEGAKYAGYDRKDAARARGWAARKRGGWVAPAAEHEEVWDDSAQAPPADDFDPNAMPF